MQHQVHQVHLRKASTLRTLPIYLRPLYILTLYMLFCIGSIILYVLYTLYAISI